MFKMAESEIQIPTRDILETEVLTINGSTSGLNPFYSFGPYARCSCDMYQELVSLMCHMYVFHMSAFIYHMQPVPHVCHMCTNATANIFLEKVLLQILATIYL